MKRVSLVLLIWNDYTLVYWFFILFYLFFQFFDPAV